MIAPDTLGADTLALMAIDSTTGKESAACDWIASWLRARGYTVTEQPVADADGTPSNRRNIFGEIGTAVVALSTHIDCVPPYLPPREDADTIWGRGSCDAKGILVAMLHAAESLRTRGHKNFGVLFVVGEETDSIGAKTFTRSGLGKNLRYIINGEPTTNTMAHGHKGVLAFTVKRRGTPGHSAYPELFDSAVHGLLEELHALQQLSLPGSERFGTTTVNIGTISGGAAGNVIAESAQATIVCRLGSSRQAIEQKIRAVFGDKTEVTVHTASDPAEIDVPEGYHSEVVRFGTDVPHLRPLCPVALVGPGSIHDAHTEHEHLKKSDQRAAVSLYIKIVEDTLARLTASA